MADDSTNNELTEERVRKVLEDQLRNSQPEDYLGVIDNEAEIIERVEKKSIFAKELTKVRLFFSLLKDHSDGVYPDATPGAIVAVGLGLSYLIWPFDVVPDFAPGGVGLVDDAIILALVWLMVRDEVEIYLHWKITQDPEYKKILQELYGGEIFANSNSKCVPLHGSLTTASSLAAPRIKICGDTHYSYCDIRNGLFREFNGLRNSSRIWRRGKPVDLHRCSCM